ncbi:OLC1v1002319C1 [Oldenlandia corymbosa var. corymbosa]|uniref:Protein TIFY n=1 Tax=Oldenlandia corymbosa var. corymbosa TaxID=529605 RepID=A0AAV1D8J4_OLDCO|nr:OLC1v1002319C1 [Oldenlandia corymbosa var. corymbosa]
MDCSASMETKDFIDINKSPSSSSSAGSKNSSMAENIRLDDDDVNNHPQPTTLSMDLFQNKTSSRKKKVVRWLMDYCREDSGGACDTNFRGGSSRRGVVDIGLGRRVGGVSRPPSLLERSLLPGLKTDARPSSPTFGECPETAQMTIFYAGTINVYDNIPADKAYAVMVLAGRCYLAVKSPPKSNSLSLGNAKEDLDLPLARQQSLRRFLEKRRDRVSNKSPYAKIG